MSSTQQNIEIYRQSGTYAEGFRFILWSLEDKECEIVVEKVKRECEKTWRQAIPLLNSLPFSDSIPFLDRSLKSSEGENVYFARVVQIQHNESSLNIYLKRPQDPHPEVDAFNQTTSVAYNLAATLLSQRPPGFPFR